MIKTIKKLDDLLLEGEANIPVRHAARWRARIEAAFIALDNMQLGVAMKHIKTASIFEPEGLIANKMLKLLKEEQ